jgi:signal transduction histidine kinase/CheY-like chemotaxis protein
MALIVIMGGMTTLLAYSTSGKFRELDLQMRRMPPFNPYSERELNEISQRMHAILNSSITSFVFLLLFVAFILVLIVMAYSNQIYQPLIDLKRGFGELMQGRFPRLRRRSDSSYEVDQMFLDFNRMTEHLENSSRDLLRAQKDALRLAEVKSNFLSNMSHEIRTPLNSIIGLSDLLLEQKLSAPANQYVWSLSKNSAVLLGLVNDILDYSRLESGKVRLENNFVNLRQLMDRVLSVIRPAAEKKGLQLKLRFDPDLPRNIMGDSLRLEQVLLNLLGNALKFTEKGEIVLGAQRNDDVPDSFLLFVKDSGIGIAPEILPKLFQRFNQGEKTVTKKYGGTGLGLAIVKQYVELMKGRVWVDSEVHRGSKFVVELPLREGLKALRGKSSERRPEGEEYPLKGKILLVDDSFDNRQLVKVYLKDTEVELVEANDGLGAVEHFKQQNFDLVLLDMQMPVVDGYTAALRMRHIESIENRKFRTPIIAFTAFALKEEIQKALDSGCDGYVIKPVKKWDLIKTLHPYMQGKGFASAPEAAASSAQTPILSPSL